MVPEIEIGEGCREELAGVVRRGEGMGEGMGHSPLSKASVASSSVDPRGGRYGEWSQGWWKVNVILVCVTFTSPSGEWSVRLVCTTSELEAPKK